MQATHKEQGLVGRPLHASDDPPILPTYISSTQNDSLVPLQFLVF